MRMVFVGDQKTVLFKEVKRMLPTFSVISHVCEVGKELQHIGFGVMDEVTMNRAETLL